MKCKIILHALPVPTGRETTNEISVTTQLFLLDSDENEIQWRGNGDLGEKKMRKNVSILITFAANINVNISHQFFSPRSNSYPCSMQIYFIAVYSYSMLMYINDQKFRLYLIKNIISN